MILPARALYLLNLNLLPGDLWQVPAPDFDFVIYPGIYSLHCIDG